MPQVSVIMPVYQMAGNEALQTAVASIKNQTYRDWELILCDDGSADHTLQVLRQIAAGDKRIRVVRSRINRRAGQARNLCIRLAKGRYIAVMDADDIADPRRLEIQTAFLDMNPQYAFVGSSAWMTDGREIWGQRRVEEIPDRKSFLGTLPFVHPSMVFRSEVIRASGGYAAAPYTCRAEDYELLMRLYAQGYRGYNIQKPLLCYREDAAAYKKRKYRYRVMECRVRYKGFQELGILSGNLRYVLKPLFAGLVPGFLMRAVKRRRFR